ncbi:hypothetical protein TNCT_343161 [Trichonephila clavata]|uniref:Uncharacterized protein n=1 Tax=Trichonephila clavata TaxID=2740835 RepID=A0A8X6FUU0_TRICU|nr:hypothetical protein TNCT_343161 [Trichonephila clavata]
MVSTKPPHVLFMTWSFIPSIRFYRSLVLVSASQEPVDEEPGGRPELQCGQEHHPVHRGWNGDDHSDHSSNLARAKAGADGGRKRARLRQI